MPVLHFATFLKLLALPTGDKLKAVAKYGEDSGGFDYWKPLRSGVIQYCAHGKSREEVHRHISQNSGRTNQERCSSKFESVADWSDKQSGAGFAPNRGVWRSPQALFSVHIEPEIGYETNSNTKITAIYPTSSATLTADTAGAGLILLRDNYRNASNETFGVYQVDTNRCFRRITNNSEAILRADIATLENAFAQILN